MTSSSLTEDLDAAFQRLETALKSREHSLRTATSQSADADVLRQKLAESEARIEELTSQVAAAEKARGEALAKLEETIGKVDQLIAAAGEADNTPAETSGTENEEAL